MKVEKQTNVLTFQITYKGHQRIWIQIPPQIKSYNSLYKTKALDLCLRLNNAKHVFQSMENIYVTLISIWKHLWF